MFKGRDRIVALSGESLFEIVQNASMPFKVKITHQVVEVLGTHFNIKPYNDEPATKPN